MALQWHVSTAAQQSAATQSPLTCAVHGHKPNIGRLQLSTVKCGRQQRLLTGTVGRCQAAAAPILVDGAAADVCPDGQAGRAVLSSCSAVLGEQQGGKAFATAVAIRSRVKRLAAADRRQRLHVDI